MWNLWVAQTSSKTAGNSKVCQIKHKETEKSGGLVFFNSLSLIPCSSMCVCVCLCVYFINPVGIASYCCCSCGNPLQRLCRANLSHSQQQFSTQSHIWDGIKLPFWQKALICTNREAGQQTVPGLTLMYVWFRHSIYIFTVSSCPFSTSTHVNYVCLLLCYLSVHLYCAFLFA